MPEPGIVFDADGKLMLDQDGKCFLGQDGDPCCCGPNAPPSTRPRWIAARLCDPSLHDLHPEVPLIVYVGVPSVGDPSCPTPAAPVFRHHFVCYTAIFGPYYNVCDAEHPAPDPGNLCLPADAEFAACSSSWSDCADERCRKFAVMGRPCAACGGAQSGLCGWADAIFLATARGPGLPLNCVVLAGGGAGCWEFRNGDPVFNIDELPPGCAEVISAPYPSCCICAAQTVGCEQCQTNNFDQRDDSQNGLLCPPAPVTGRPCCCGPDAKCSFRQQWIDVGHHADGTVDYHRTTIEGTCPGGYIYRVETSQDGVSWSVQVEQPLQCGGDGSRLCGWQYIYGGFGGSVQGGLLYRPDVWCARNGEPGMVYTASVNRGGCESLVYSWTVETDDGNGERLSQAGTITISCTRGTGGCTQGCGTIPIGQAPGGIRGGVPFPGSPSPIGQAGGCSGCGGAGIGGFDL